MTAKPEYLKSAKYAALKVSHHIVPFAMETSGARSGSTQPRQGHWATRGGTEQGVPPPKYRHHSTEGECCSSAWDCREVGGSLLRVTEGAPSPLYYCFITIVS